MRLRFTDGDLAKLRFPRPVTLRELDDRDDEEEEEDDELDLERDWLSELELDEELELEDEDEDPDRLAVTFASVSFL